MEFTHSGVMPGTQSSLRRLRKLVCAAGIYVLLSSSAKDRMARELGRLAAAARANIHATSFYFARV
jgi:hypothetical protein